MEGCPVTKLGKMFLNYLATLCMKINMFQYVMSECALKKGKTSLFKSHKGLLVTYFTNNLMKFSSRVYSNTVFDLMPSFRPPLTYPDMQFLSLDGPRFIGYINFVDPPFLARIGILCWEVYFSFENEILENDRKKRPVPWDKVWSLQT